MIKKRRKLGILIDEIYVQARFFRKRSTVKKESKKRLKILKGGYKGSGAEFNKVVKEFWKPYGIKPKKYWFDMYCDGKKAYDPRYIPDDLMIGKIYPYFNNLVWGRAYADKGAYDITFPGLKKPGTIIKNIAGRYYKSDRTLISEEEAVRIALEAGRFIVKFTTNSSGGRNVQVFETGEVTEELIRSIFKEYRFNFIFQELIDQHEKLAAIHKTSLNTLRVQSLFFKGETHILSAQLRMGSGDARVDNYTSGGYAANIYPDGRLGERAVNKKEGWAYKHPCGMKFSDFVVPCYDKVIETIKNTHPGISQLGIIGWDFAIDKDGDPVFIEINLMPETNQNGSGPTFGELTEKVLQDVFVDKSLDGAFL